MATSKKPTSTELAKWDEELARQAAIAAGMESSTAAGQFFSIRSGVLSYNDQAMPNNEMAVVILDSIIENVYYEDAYDADNPSSPMCFAFGRDEREMVPHANIPKADQQCGASGLCSGCEQNQFGSANVGKGKACRNMRRLALIPAGTLTGGKFKAFNDASHYATAQIAFMRVAPTSIKGYAAFVKQIAGALKRPPHGVFTKIKVVPDPKSQFKLTFEALSQVPNELLGEIMSRHDEAKTAIDFPYAPREEKPVKGKAVAAKKKSRKY